MKAQEVINIIEDVTWQDNGRHYGKINTAREMAIEALEKQIPKKPMPDSKYYGVGICPVCNAVFTDNSTRYCGNCGQALDWGESNGTD